MPMKIGDSQMRRGREPTYDFARVVALLAQGKDPRSPPAQALGAKGYHDRIFTNEPYPVE